MRLIRRPLAALLIACCVLGACSSDKPALKKPSSSTTDQGSLDSSASATAGGDATQPPADGGDVDCAALTLNLANIVVNWQVVLGLSNSEASEWAQIPLGSLPKFGDQLVAVTAALGSDAEAAQSLSYMSGANDIVQRGFGGDAAAKADLATYLGTDVAANISKQIPISLAYQNAGCK